MCRKATPVCKLRNLPSFPCDGTRPGEGGLLHLDPLALVDPYKIPTRTTPYLTTVSGRVIFHDPVLPAVQDLALTDLPIPEQLCPAFRTPYYKHRLLTQILETPEPIGLIGNQPLVL